MESNLLRPRLLVDPGHLKFGTFLISRQTLKTGQKTSRQLSSELQKHQARPNYSNILLPSLKGKPQTKAADSKPFRYSKGRQLLIHNGFNGQSKASELFASSRASREVIQTDKERFQFLKKKSKSVFHREKEDGRLVQQQTAPQTATEKKDYRLINFLIESMRNEGCQGWYSNDV